VLAAPMVALVLVMLGAALPVQWIGELPLMKRCELIPLWQTSKI
jgi:hypothetical protein